LVPLDQGRQALAVALDVIAAIGKHTKKAKLEQMQGA